jgi:hypothetical protein
MIKRFVLLFSAISLAVVASAANTFRVDLYQPTTINGTTLKAGEAKAEIQEGKIVLRQGKTSVEASIKVENNKDKYSFTSVGYRDDHKIKDICIGGTTTHIFFEDSASN